MIGAMLKTELRRFFATPLAWVIIAVSQLILAWAFFSELEYYENIQAQLAAKQTSLGVTSLVVIPALLNGLNIIMLMTPLLTMRSIAEEWQSRRLDMLLASPMTAGQLLVSKYLAVLVVLGLFWLTVLLQVMTLQLATGLDLGRVLLLWTAGLFVISTFIAAGLWLSSLARHPLIAAITTYGLLILLRFVGQNDDGSLLHWFSITPHLQAAQLGLFSSTDLMYFLMVIGLFLILGWTQLLKLRHTQERWSARFSIILILICLVLSWPVLKQHEFTYDLSANRNNTLSAPSQEMMQTLDKPLSFTVYLNDSNSVLKKQILQLLNRFKRERPQIVISFIDPQNNPEAARTLGITKNGELLVRYNERQQLVKKLNEEEIRKTIHHLSSRQQGWILNLQGHQEVSLFDEGLYGASLFMQNLRARGYQLRDFNLLKQGQLPANAELIIIGAPKNSLSLAETALIDTYMENGGNLLWLTDADLDFKTKGYNSLPDISVLPGVIVDATAAKLDLSSPDNAVITKYADHSLTSGLSRHTLFPQAAALKVNDFRGWTQETRLLTNAASWNETGAIKGNIERDPVLFEEQGPLPLAILLSRQQDNHTQRTAFIGDSDFIRNQLLGRGDNLQLTLNLLHWLTATDGKPQQAATRPSDQLIELAKTGRAIYGLFYLFLLPTLLIISGLLIVRKRRNRK
ncbi:MAG: ABC transporter permease subunit [Gammaproteobacteria bacterium]|nr:Gldg family protein [Gammaproteobacteria bacterium]NNJ90464.1 ABC transporter permease subunit [Gammaproteobacteria bacterium]